jgi:hypothetical protein
MCACGLRLNLVAEEWLYVMGVESSTGSARCGSRRVRGWNMAPEFRGTGECVFLIIVDFVCRE